MIDSPDIHRRLLRNSLNRSINTHQVIASPLSHLKVKLHEPVPVRKPTHQAESSASLQPTSRSPSAPLIKPEMVFIQPKFLPSSNKSKQQVRSKLFINSQTSIVHNPPISWERSLILQACTVSPDSLNTQSKSLHDQPTSVEFRQAVSRKASIHEKVVSFRREPLTISPILSLRMMAFKCKQNTTSDEAPDDVQSNFGSEFDTKKTAKNLAKVFTEHTKKESKDQPDQLPMKRSFQLIQSSDSPQTESIQRTDKYTQDYDSRDRPSEPLPTQQSKAPIRSILSLNPKHSPQLKSRVILARITKNLPKKRVSFSPTRTIFFVKK